MISPTPPESSTGDKQEVCTAETAILLALPDGHALALSYSPRGAARVTFARVLARDVHRRMRMERLRHADVVRLADADACTVCAAEVSAEALRVIGHDGEFGVPPTLGMLLEVSDTTRLAVYDYFADNVNVIVRARTDVWPVPYEVRRDAWYAEVVREFAHHFDAWARQYDPRRGQVMTFLWLRVMPKSLSASARRNLWPNQDQGPPDAVHVPDHADDVVARIDALAAVRGLREAYDDPKVVDAYLQAMEGAPRPFLAEQLGFDTTGKLADAFERFRNFARRHLGEAR